MAQISRPAFVSVALRIALCVGTGDTTIVRSILWRLPTWSPKGAAGAVIAGGARYSRNSMISPTRTDRRLLRAARRGFSSRDFSSIVIRISHYIGSLKQSLTTIQKYYPNLAQTIITHGPKCQNASKQFFLFACHGAATPSFSNTVRRKLFPKSNPIRSRWILYAFCRNRARQLCKRLLPLLRFT